MKSNNHGMEKQTATADAEATADMESTLPQVRNLDQHTNLTNEMEDYVMELGENSEEF